MSATAPRRAALSGDDTSVVFRLLGPMEVVRHGETIELGGARPRSLLALLLLHRGTVVSVDRVVDELWGDSPPSTARHMVEVYVSRLRKALGDGIVVTRRPGYALEIEPECVDAERFERLLTAGRELLALGDATAAAAYFEEALALWRGPALADFGYESFAKSEIMRLEELRLLAEEERIEARLALGDSAGAVGELEELVAEAPLRERRRAQLMLALYRSGRQAEALAVYRAGREALVESLGVEPGPELRDLERAILGHDDWLTAGRTVGRVRPSVGKSAAGLRRRLPVRIAVGVIALAVATAAVVGLGGGGSGERRLNAAANSVALIDPSTGALEATLVVGENPVGIASSVNEVWVTTSPTDYVTRIDARTGRVSERIRVGHAPSGVGVHADAVWVANSGDGTVSRIDRRTRAIDTFEVGHTPLAAAVGEGSVWVTNSADRTVSRIDPRTGRTTATIPTDAVGRGAAVGGGWVWITDESADEVVRVDPRTNSVVERIGVGAGPTAITFGEGAVWVANALGGTVSRIDPRTAAVTATVHVGDGPAGIAIGRGSVWVAAEFTQRVIRIEPSSRPSVAATIPLGNRPKGIAANDAGVWVAVQPAGAGHRGGRLVALTQPFPTVDPALAGGSVFHHGLSLVYDGLTGYRRTGGSEGTRLLPNLAVSLPRARAGATSFTFRLRSGIRYADGRLVRPIDFRRALERTLSLAGSQFADSDLALVVGAERCATTASRCDLSEGVGIRGDTITFRLSASAPFFLRELTHLHPVPPGTPWRDVATTPVPGTGPYAIESFVPGRQVRLVRNPHFRVSTAAARPDGYADEIVFRLEGDLARSVRDVSAGRADAFLHPVPPEQLGDVSVRHADRLHVEPQLGVMMLFLDTTQPPFDDVRVRRALSYAVDRRRLVDMGGGPALREPACQVIPPRVPGYRRHCRYTVGGGASRAWKAPDMAAARRLVAASGTAGADVTVWTWPAMGQEGRYLVSLFRLLGYRAKLKELPDAGAYFGAIFDPKTRAQSGIVGFFNTQEGASALGPWSCGRRTNAARFCDRRLDADLARALRVLSRDPNAAARIWADLDRRLVGQAPVVPLFVPHWPMLVSKRVGNWQFHPYRFVLLDQLWVR